MIPVAISGGVTLLCPEDGRYSFYNSPYPAHRNMTGIDLYPNPSSGGIALSPVDGEIAQVRRVRAPSGHGFDAPAHDTVTVIRTPTHNAAVKILHVDTEAEAGEKVYAGQALGPLIRSGYFGYQTPLHAHVEVRPTGDPLRVRGGHPMESLMDLNDLKVTDDMTGVVASARPGYAQINLRKRGPWVAVEVGGRPGIIDGGIPLYGWFGTHVDASLAGSTIKLLGKRIGVVTDTRPRTCVARCTEFEARIGATPVDLFFILTPRNRTLLVATSRKRGELDLHEGEEVSVALL